MPRLLLVDDNPSIHKIAETLLAATDIELVCLESGEEALRRVHAGEHFDVALLDTAMAGLDGWGLLEQLRTLPATSRIPIAMMAGVLDTVDPVKIQQAPIQGFLKKPVELRDLGDRVHKLLEAPMPVPASAVDTIPAASVEELVGMDSDILVLGPEDLLVPEVEPAAPIDEIPLELEELDLETLHGLQDDLPVPPTDPQSMAAEVQLEPLEPIEAIEVLEPVDVGMDLSPVDAWAEEAWEKSPPAPTRAAEEMPFLVTSDELPDLGEMVAAAEAPTLSLDASGLALEAPKPETDLSLEEELDLGPLVLPVPPEPPLLLPAAGAGLAVAAGATAFAMYESKPEPAAPAVAPMLPPPLPEPVPEPPAAPGSARSMVEILLRDPEAMDALAKALATHLSDRTLKEVVWEVMPELAGRLKR